MDKEQEMLLAAGKTPPIKDTQAQTIDNDTILDLVDPDREASDIDIFNIVDEGSRRLEDNKGKNAWDRLSADDRADHIGSAMDGRILPGADLDRNLTGQNVTSRDDAEELMAETQGWSRKAGNGLGRMTSEFVLNVLEMPGIIGGAATALATGDITDMTDNWWVKLSEDIKSASQEYFNVHQRQSTLQGGVWEKMSSMDWWATDGASGAAFMGSALLGGMGYAKGLSKILSVSSKLARGGAKAQKVVRYIDKMAGKVGFAESAPGQAIGNATKGALDLVNTTMANTIYEAGFEALTAKEGYLDALNAQLNAGDITYEEFTKLKPQAYIAARNVFSANSALLLVPNLIMSKMMLGPRGVGLGSKVFGGGKPAIEVAEGFGVKAGGATSTFQKASQAAVKAKGKLAKIGGALKSEPVKVVGQSLKRGASNLTREGLIEEGGQGAIEQYYSGDYLNVLKEGQRKRNFLTTYTDFLGTTDGKIAVLFGGLLSAGPSMYSARKEYNSKKESTNKLLNLYNESASNFENTLNARYESYPNGHPKEGQLILDASGKPKLDMTAALGAAEANSRQIMMMEIIAEARRTGDVQTEKAFLTRLETDSFNPFIGAGEAGIDLLKDYLTKSPAIGMQLEATNKENGTKITLDQFVGEQVQKAKDQLKDYVYYQDNVATIVGNEFIKDNNIQKEDMSEVDEWKEIFEANNRANFTIQKAQQRYYQKEMDRLDVEIKDARVAGLTDIAAEKTAEKRQYDKWNKASIQTSTDLTTRAKIEPRWNKEFNNSMLSKRINDDDVVGYLDKFFVDIDSVNSVTAVKEILAKAEEDGLILTQVKIDKMPTAELMELANSNDIKDVYAAHYVLSQLEDKSQDALDAKETAKDNLNALSRASNEVLSKIEENTISIAQEIQTIQDRQTTNSDEISANFAKVEEIINDLDNLENKTKKGRPTNEFKKKLRELQTQRDEALKLQSKLAGQSRANTTALNKNARKLTANINVLVALQEVSVDPEVGLMIKNLSAFAQFLGLGDKGIQKNLLDTLPISGEELAQLITSNSKFMMDDTIVDNAADLIGDMNSHDMLAREREVLIKQAEFARYIADQATRILLSYKKSKKANFNADSILAMNAIIEEAAISLLNIEDRLDEIDKDIQRVTDTAIDGMDSASYAFDEMLQTVNEIFAGKAPKGVKNPKVEPAPPAPPAAATPVAPGPLARADLKEFKAFEDTTNGEGMSRIDERYQPAFGKMFSNNLDTITKYVTSLENSMVDETGNTNYDAIINLSLVLEAHPFLEVSEEAREALSKLQGDGMGTNNDPTTDIWSTYFDIKPQATIFDDVTPKAAPTPVRSDNAAINTINNTNIKEELNNFIQLKYEQIAEDDLAGLEKLAREANEYWTEAQDKVGSEGFIRKGSKVHWESGGKSNFGTIQSIFKSTSSGANALIFHDDGTVHVVNTLAVTKMAKNQDVSNEESWKKYKETIGNPSRQVGVFGFPLLFTKDTTIRVEDQIYQTNQAMVKYLETTRDKSKDTLKFHFNIKTLESDLAYAKSIPGLEARGIVPGYELEVEKTERNQRLLDIYNSAVDGKEISKDDLEFMINNMPISMRVHPSEEGAAGAGSFLPTLNEAKDATDFEATLKSIRTRILEAWVNDNFETVKDIHEGVIESITANWAHLAGGQLNKEQGAAERGGNRVDKLRGYDPTVNKLVVVSNEKEGDLYNEKGESIPANFNTENKGGLPFILVQTPEGKDFYLALQQNTLNGTPEHDLVMSIIDEVMNSGTSQNSLLTQVTKDKLKTTVPLLFEAFGEELGRISNQELLDTIYFEGRSDSQVKIKLDGEAKTISIGDEVWNSLDYNENEGVIRSTIGQKYFRTGIRNTSESNLLTVSNPKYKQYLMESRILSTNIKEDAPIFTFVKGEDSEFIKGLNPYISTETLNDTTRKVAPGKVVIAKVLAEAVGEVQLNPAIIRKMRDKRIDFTALGSAAKLMLNKLEADKRGTVTKLGRVELERAVQDAIDKQDTNKPEDCNN